MREETGSALALALVMITLLTVVSGTVLAVHVAQYRFIRRDVHRLQARYAAEAGVYLSLDRLQADPARCRFDTVFALPEGLAARVTVEPYGGYAVVRSVAVRRRSRSVVRALVGEVPPADFEQAVLLWDTASGLTLAGDTRITGNVTLGPRGLVPGTFEGRRFTGRIDGAVGRMPDLVPPFFDGALLAEAVAWCEQLLMAPDGQDFPEQPREVRAEAVRAADLRTKGARAVDDRAAESPTEDGRSAAWQLPGRNRVVQVTGDLHLTGADALVRHTPLTVAASGDLLVEGPLRFAPGTVFIAGGVLRVAGDVMGREGLFYGRAGVEVDGGASFSGQLLSRRRVRVSGTAYLRYPSVLFVTGEAADLGGGIEVVEEAVVDGTLVHPPLPEAPSVQRARVLIGPRARVRGAIYNALETELHGAVYGSLLSHQLYFYASPTSYVNWLKDATVDLAERPVSYLLPLRFSRHPRLAVLSWTVGAEDREAPGSAEARAPAQPKRSR